MDSNAASLPSESGTVMASIDGDGERERLIIADVSCDQAWVSAPADDTCSLLLWR